MENLFAQLNESQQAAVRHLNGPSLVIAGAGSGKTRVLTYKIAYLLSQGVPAYNILALTFTNKAAAEMKERVAQLVGDEVAKGLNMGTFHSIFARILRIESQALAGYDSNYTILDTEDVKKLITETIKSLHLDKDIYKASKVLGIISKAKNDLIPAEMYAESEMAKYDAMNGMPAISSIYQAYVKACRKSNSMDFDDLLLLTNVLFRDNPPILEKYQRLFRYILVDEYQDTNSCQYHIIKRLALPENNLCVVGDDAQSIYSFRGAKIENILGYQKDYADCKLFKLEENYRSTKTIVEAANSVIEKNKYQIKKSIYSNLEDGEKINLVECKTDAEEGIKVASAIETLIHKGEAYSSCAILYRTNAQSRILEEALNKKHIPCKIVKGTSFFQRKEIKDVLSYVRVILNPYDEIALERIVNYPARSIGDTTIQKIRDLAITHNISMWGVMKQIEKTGNLFAATTKNKILDFVQLIQLFMADKSEADAYSLLNRIVEKINFKAAIEKEYDKDDAQDRYNNILELLNGAKEFVEQELDPEAIYLQNYMEKIALLTDIDEEETENPNKVLLMTVHAAKGLEFKHCFLVGLEENVFPSQMSMDTPQNIEEERRLFYVAITRAMKTVMISYALMRRKFGNLTQSQASRFIRDIDEKYLNGRVNSSRDLNNSFWDKSPYSRNGNSEFGFSKQRDSVFDTSYHENRTSLIDKHERGSFVSQTKNRSGLFGDIQMSKKPLFESKEISQEQSNYVVPSSINQIVVGKRVLHSKFGEGVVKECNGSDANAYAIIAFDNWGEKKLLLKFAKLQIAVD